MLGCVSSSCSTLLSRDAIRVAGVGVVRSKLDIQDCRRPIGCVWTLTESWMLLLAKSLRQGVVDLCKVYGFRIKVLAQAINRIDVVGMIWIL